MRPWPGSARRVGRTETGHRASGRPDAERRSLLRTLAGAAVTAALTAGAPSPWAAAGGAPDAPRPRAAAGGAADAPRVGPDDVHSVLIVVDVQNCFVSGGTLAVPHGEDVVPIINRLIPRFANVVVTQDWHTPGHVSFASSHPGRKPYETLDLPYGAQVLWPDHCVMGTDDARLVKDLDTTRAQLVIRKGFHRELDSYSAFREADHRTATGLGGYLKERAISRVFVCGLATDFCVAWTALDARRAGFDTTVIEDACRAIDLNGSLAAAWTTLSAAGVRRIRSTDL
jgi:nicotinamidase/pyrazinamidase